MSATIWDDCTQITDTINENYWLSDQTTTNLTINTSIQSPIQTGSIQIDQPAQQGLYQLFIVQRYNPNASKLLDYNQLRPDTIYLQSQQPLHYEIEIVTREPDGYPWIRRQITSGQLTINQMTPIQLTYTNIPLDALTMTAQLNIILFVNQQPTTTYISGITATSGTPETPQPPPPTPQQIPKPTVIGNTLHPTLHGIGFEHWHDDPTGWTEQRGVWNPNDIIQRLQFIQANHLNLIKIQVCADWILQETVDFTGDQGPITTNYLQNIWDFCAYASQHNIYVEVCISYLLNGYDKFINNYQRSKTPYTPYINSTDQTVIPDTATYNQAIEKLANKLKDLPNTLLGTWNEPSYPAGQQEYDNYFNNLPITLQTIRNTGYNNPIVTMGSVSLVQHTGLTVGNDSLNWAITHPTLFTNYGQVIADVHAYYCYLCRPDLGWCNYPLNYNELQSYWLNNCRINEARNMNICVAMFETGVGQYGFPQPIPEQNQALQNGLTILNTQNISWLAWTYNIGTQFSTLTTLTPPTWNSTGSIIQTVATPTTPTTWIPLLLIIPIGILGYYYMFKR